LQKKFFSIFEFFYEKVSPQALFRNENAQQIIKILLRINDTLKMNKQTKENLIRLSMKEAEKGIDEGNSPFGAVLTDKKGHVISTTHNTAATACDPTAHAEINLLRQAGKKLKTTIFKEYYLFCNAESCSMCMSAAIKAGITHFYFGASSEKSMNPYLTIFDIAKKSKNKLYIETGILNNECAKQIKLGRNKLSK
jgi:tRNA(adenine34) deaminase